MKLLSEYTKDEVIRELLEKCPILKYHPYDYYYYEMVYYVDFPLYGDYEMGDNTFIGLYYQLDMNRFYYIARIGGKKSNTNVIY